jgi:predicted Zn finger-like uncharacterized protein
MQVICPKCQTKLRLDHSPGSNMAIQCSKCETIFEVALPEPQRESKPRKKRKARKQSGVSATTWIIAGIGVIAMVVICLFAAGQMGYGPLDFGRKDRIRNYCQEMDVKVSLLIVLVNENRPGVLTQLFNSDKSLEHIQKSRSLIQKTRTEVEKKDAPTDCQQVKQAILDMLARVEKWAGEDIPRARELMKSDSAGAEALLKKAEKDLLAANERIRNEMTTLHQKYK